MIEQENIPYTADEIKVMVKTIEELRKKYNKALDRAKVYHTGGSISDAHITEVIFPELKESEDEKIKRELRNDFEHPAWISVEDELPRCYIPYNNWDGTPSDVLESEKVVALLSDGTICIATFNQNLDVDTDKPTGSPYWFDEGHPEDGDRIRGEVTHWMPLPQPPEHFADVSKKISGSSEIQNNHTKTIEKGGEQ